MTPEQEALAADAAFQAALLAIGVETLQDALAMWAALPVTQTAQLAAAWLNQAVHLVLARREQARDVAVAYYRLARALRTGRTIPDPRDPVPTSVTLQQLRSEFDQAVQAHVGPDRPTTTFAHSTPSADNPQASPADPGGSQGDSAVPGDTELIPIDRLDGIESIEPDLADSAQQEAETVLAALGPVNSTRLQTKIDTNAPAKQVDAERQDAHDRAGTRQAAAAERVALNGGRGTIFALADSDPRVIGWVRISTTGTPCGFCAMLISRGLALKGLGKKQYSLYGSKASATGKTSDAPSVVDGLAEEGDLYHDNCHCEALPVYSQSQYANDPKFEQNREMARAWVKVTEGLSGDDALNAFRRYIEGRKSDATTTHTADVQAA